MTKLLFEIFVAYNATQIISESSLFTPVWKTLLNSKYWLFRHIGRLLSCFLCTSVWVSFLLTLTLYDYAANIGITNLSWLFNALFISSICWWMHIIEDKLT